MTYFSRLQKDDRHYDGRFAEKGKGAPPPHLRDKNKSHSEQGGKASTAYADTASGVSRAAQPDDQDTTDQ